MNEINSTSPLIKYIQESCILLNDIDIICDDNPYYFKVIYNKNDYSKLLRLAKKSGFRKAAFPLGFIDGYSFIYKTQEPLVFIKESVVIEMWDQLCCKSFFQKAWLPLDKMIVNSTWDNTQNTSGWRCLNADYKMIYVITNSVFTKKRFSEYDRSFIQTNKEVFTNPEFIMKLEKEFFLFTPELLELLKDERYDEVLNRLRKFRKY